MEIGNEVHGDDKQRRVFFNKGGNQKGGECNKRRGIIKGARQGSDICSYIWVNKSW